MNDIPKDKPKKKKGFLGRLLGSNDKPKPLSEDATYRGWLNVITKSDEDTAKQGVSDDEHTKFMNYYTGSKEYQKAKETKAKGGMIDKYKKGGSVSKKKKKKPRGVGVAKRGW